MIHPARLYLQLYSLRHETAVDALGTLRQVRALGFDGVEMSNGYGWPVEPWRALLDETGLSVVSAHVGLETLESDLAARLKFFGALGASTVVVPAVPDALRHADGYREAARRLNVLGPQVVAAGFALAYHNHAFEFDPLDGANGRCGMDILLDETDPALVRFEFDTFWLAFGGRDAAGFIREHSQRVFSIHAKDFRKRDRADVPAGQGDVDFHTLLPLCVANDWPVIVEYEGGNAVESVRQGAAFLRPLLG